MPKIARFMMAASCAFGELAWGEVKTMTLREVLDLALAQNPDIMLARLDQQKAREQVTIAKDPFVPKVYMGSGAAWTSGFPASIEGSAPSILNLKTQMALFDRPQSYQVAQANENLRGIAIDVSKQQDEIVYRVASLYLDAEQAARSLRAAQSETEDLARVLDYFKARVEEGRELPLAAHRADLAVRKAKNAVENLTLDQLNAEMSLAMSLGMKPDDRVQPSAEDRKPLVVPVTEDESIATRVETSRDLKRLESSIQAKMLEIKGYKAQRLPKVNLVAQYELFAKYYYQNYFSTFQRNSGQLGASFELPVLIGRSSAAYVRQAEDDIAKLRIELDRTRARVTADVRRAFQDVKRAENARDYAREDLDVAREQVSVDLARHDEGRAPISELEQSRAVEQEKWLAYYEAQHTVERARLSVMRQTGTLLAGLR
jgi:outer membrane protein TolC